jgi:hypothetical protein
LPDAEAGEDESLRECFEEITRGVAERPIRVVLTEGTAGILEIGWNEHVLPILASDAGAFVAASTLGDGRIVAFSGQDFISSDDASTFIGIEGNEHARAKRCALGEPPERIPATPGAGG